MEENTLTILDARTEEVPHYFDFKKSDIMGHHPTMANLNYDPFPNAKNDDTVRTEIIARKLVLRAKLKAPAGSITMANSLEYQGHSFILDRIQKQWREQSELCEIEGFAFLTPCDPMQALAKLRTTLAAANRP
jgi:hypothetical protein